MKQLFATNKKTGFEYFILDKFEAGIVLSGSEVKSIRNKGVNIEGAFITQNKGELYLIGAHIQKYKCSITSHQENRVRKLLLKSKEIKKILGAVSAPGQTCVPLKVYEGDTSMIKIEIAIARGKKQHDKRESIKQRDWNREKSRLLSLKSL